ncbi:bifunctional alpha/beta hydrolase/OsmC family protein [Aliikangiella coralliicola]|uniref:OsmC family protein n=1 Tax=Aliikangiella coralliicola TaxID=2592383 RepID=A0A545UCV3_9GAMM|nr:bifunctional alpha/beta hydrolase/OsmC family protein [Aliikangiella coralliicola]TQV87296.1 OsmC family protein [Aliikangiella coralliicola]
MGKRRTKLEFPGADGLKVAGLLETPDKSPKAFALFAHCFTCGKDIVAASRIARALVARGYAVLRFDFTGLGSSDGDFANSNFSTNVQDLIHAVEFLRENYKAPSILIGHSLGGAAVLAAANSVPEAVGVVTIGAPSDPQHVVKQFACDIDTIQHQGKAEVNLAGRKFTIKKQFLDDLTSHHQSEEIGKMKKALLIFHSPLDQTVSINEAEKIYRSAKHPKSFVSLDDADHLLTKAKDAEYVASTIAAWVSRYLDDKDEIVAEDSKVKKGHVHIIEKNKQFTRAVISDSHLWLADEPTEVGGNDLGPDPYEHLLAALGTCTSMTIRMYANRKKIPLKDVVVELQHSREHIKDCEDCEKSTAQLEVLEKKIQLAGDLSEEQRQRLLEIADRCPVHKTLHGKMEIRTALADYY